MTDHAKDTLSLWIKCDPDLTIVELSDEEIENADNPFVGVDQ